MVIRWVFPTLVRQIGTAELVPYINSKTSSILSSKTAEILGLENRLPEQNVPLKAKAICPPRLDVIGKKTYHSAVPFKRHVTRWIFFFEGL
jgi:hypothetical protein